MLNYLLNARSLPPFMEREKMLEILLREEYGYLPPKPDRMSWQESECLGKRFCAGKATVKKVELTSQINGENFAFPVYVAIPKGRKRYPFFIHINFRDCVPDLYMPTEEILDNGFAVLSFCYKDVTADNDDFTSGLSGVLYPDGKRKPSSAGKLSMWAWAAQRVMDYAQTLESLDMERSIVCGHSRLGKTALLTAATDERFAYAYSNDSGCSGASLSRGKNGEQVRDVMRVFPYWFCENYRKYVTDAYSMPFDQHWLLASIAPRFLYVADADRDFWADPISGFLSCRAASAAYEAVGLTGLVCGDQLPKTGEYLHEGTIGYHLRAGEHYFSRADWQGVMDFVKKHSPEKSKERS